MQSYSADLDTAIAATGSNQLVVGTHAQTRAASEVGVHLVHVLWRLASLRVEEHREVEERRHHLQQVRAMMTHIFST